MKHLSEFAPKALSYMKHLCAQARHTVYTTQVPEKHAPTPFSYMKIHGLRAKLFIYAKYFHCFRSARLFSYMNMLSCTLLYTIFIYESVYRHKRGDLIHV